MSEQRMRALIEYATCTVVENLLDGRDPEEVDDELDAVRDLLDGMPTEQEVIEALGRVDQVEPDRIRELWSANLTVH